LKRCNSFIDMTGSDTDDEDGESTTRRSNGFVDLTGSDYTDDIPHAKRQKLGAEKLQSDGRTTTVKLEDEVEVEQEAIRLTPAQKAVVQLALRSHNIFLTGAAGSGKTATLKEILRRLKARYPPRRGAEDSKYPSVQVVAPTGIAALPLDGKTTYSFAGW
jgi:superfamily II DNA/RNA helicase